ncbi:hypothetical protein A9Q93_02060 [Nonlabens dokdonensis]|uniref:DUF1573 domain-containing protein n=1 Tax=Nonlabens dokdonensis TaxID=328515 RepID=A0A1Z8BBR8_9FLAO|nr:DUF1573 domain-containing protein [Nonlabens dokdonensis]OUS20009.1 hypothetical protein A9Q93_02060 [Nonlabens dokdonensis]
MKKILHIFFIVAVTSTALNAQNNSTLDPLTTIKFDSTTIDYGEIKKGSDGVRVFTFTNTGEELLKIYKIYSSCSCDILSKPENPIKPGDKGEIKVKYDTNKVGPIVKTLTVYGNIKEKLIPLKLKGLVLKDS